MHAKLALKFTILMLTNNVNYMSISEVLKTTQPKPKQKDDASDCISHHCGRVTTNQLKGGKDVTTPFDG